MNTITYYSLNECAEGQHKVELVDHTALNGSYFVTPADLKIATKKTDPLKYSERLDQRMTEIDEAISCLNFEKSLLESLKGDLQHVQDI